MDFALDVGKLLFSGFVMYLGAEWMVKGASGLALSYGVKPLVIGLTVVAYGTSTPELVVSSAAILDGNSSIVLGNVIGSCIANLGMILGLTALIKPPRVDPRLMRREIPILLGSVAAIPLVTMDGGIQWYEALVLLVGSILFTLWTLHSEGSANTPDVQELEQAAEAGGAPGGHSKLRLYTVTFIGLGLLIGGGEIFVDGAVGVAGRWLSERVIGLTIIAVGTSLPELAACVVAAMRNHSEIAIGNVIGSNIFNVLLILGIVPLLGPLEVPFATLVVDLGFLFGLTLFGTVIMRTERLLTRLEGAVLTIAYAAFVVIAVIRN